ncbi:MAG: hypothetical protein V1720_01475 [bacterium]
MNKHYINMYKIFPNKIEIDNMRMICSEFLIGNHSIEIKLADIEEIKGGMFGGNMSRPIYIRNQSKGIVIGLSPHIKNNKQLLKIILSNISNELYISLLTQMKELNGEQKELIKRVDLK